MDLVLEQLVLYRWFLDNFIQNKAGTHPKDTIINHIFDFESAQNKNVSSFYASFGATQKNFIVINYNNLPIWIKIIQRFFRKIKVVFK